MSKLKQGWRHSNFKNFPMKKLIVVADTGKLRAFRLTPSEMTGSRARIEEIDTDLHLPKPAPTDVTDDDGNFPSGALNGAPMRHGESHGREQEEERRAIREIAHVIPKITAEEGFEIWNFAASPRVCKRFVQQLPMSLQERLTRVEEHDYTGLPIKEIENIFR
jgi:protein required for attachment to host cells